MLMGAILAGLGGAVLSAGGALVSGHSLLTACGCYVAGGSATMLGVLALGQRGGGTPQDRLAGAPFDGTAGKGYPRPA